MHYGNKRDSGQHSYIFVKKIFKHYNGSNYWPFFRFPRLWNNLLDFKNSKFFLHDNIFKFSIWMNFWNFEDWEEIFIYWGDYLAILEKIFLEWMSTCYLIDTVHWLHIPTPFYFYNWHIGIIKGSVDVHHLQSSIY